MRKTNIIITLALVAVLAGGSWYALDTIQTDKLRTAAQSGIPAFPDLSEATDELEQRLRDTSREVRESNKPVEALGRLAMLYQSNGYAGEAEHALNALRELDPENGRWTYLLARLRMDERDLEGLENLLLETVRLAPDYGPAHLRLGDLLTNLERFDEARTHYETRLKVDPNDPLATYALATIDVHEGDTEKAIARLKALVEKHPDLAQPNIMLANLLNSTGDREGAMKHFQAAQNPAPQWSETDPWVTELNEFCFDPQFLLHLGRARAESGRPEQAIPFLEKAESLAPGDERIISARARVYGMLDRPEDQQALLRETISQSPKTSTLYADLADFMLREQRVDEALDVLRDGLRESPGRSDLHYALGFALLHTDRRDEATGAFRRATETDPENGDAFVQLGHSLLQSEKPDEGKAAVQRALELQPSNSDALFILAGVAFEEREFDEAKRYAERLLELHPNEPEAHGLYAAVFLQQGNAFLEAGEHAKAEQHYREGLKAAPGYGALHGALGMMYAQTDRMDEAIAEWERYVTITPNDMRAYLLLGNALGRVGRNDHARQVYQVGRTVAEQSGDTGGVEGFEKLIAELGQPAGQQEGSN